MCAAAGGKWLGIRFDADAWPFSADVEEFEARRAVGQLARTYFSSNVRANVNIGSDLPKAVLPYIIAADLLAKKLREVVLVDLVAQARLEGVTWKEIGCALGVGETAAQKRFGVALDEGRQNDLAREAEVVWFTNGVASGHLDSNDVSVEDKELFEEIRADLEGSTPEERFVHVVNVLLPAVRSSYECAKMELVLSPNERDGDNISANIAKATKKLAGAVETLLLAPEQWSSIPTWCSKPISADQAHYHQPATYLFYVMRQIYAAFGLHMEAWHSCALGPEEKLAKYELADYHLTIAGLILNRDDVQSAIARRK